MKKFLTYDLETTFLQKKQKRPVTRMLEIALKKTEESFQRLINPCEQYSTGNQIIESLDTMKQHPQSSLRFWTKLLIEKHALPSNLKRADVFKQADEISKLLVRSDIARKNTGEYTTEQWLYALENNHDKVSVAKQFLDKYEVDETPKSVKFFTTKEALSDALEFGQKHAWIAHNGKSFDMPIVIGNCDRNNLTYDSIEFKDSLRMLRIKLDMDSYSQPNIYRNLFSKGYKAHHALHDCVALQEILDHVAEKEKTTVLDLFKVKKLPIKVKCNSDLVSIKGIGPKTAIKFKERGIASKKDLYEYVDTHSIESFLEKFKGLYRYRKLAERLYHTATV